MNNDLIKDRLKKLREEKGIFQKDLADKFHITRATIASYETGKSLPSLEIVVKYAYYFNCTTDYILCRTEEKKHKITKDEDVEVVHDNDVLIQKAAMELFKKTLDKIIEKG